MDEATATVARSASRAWRAVSGHAGDLDEVRTRAGQGPCVARTRVPAAELRLPGVAAAALLPEQLGRQQDPLDRTPIPWAGADPGRAARRSERPALWARSRPRKRDALDDGRWQLSGRLAEQALNHAAPRARLLRLASRWHDV